MIRILSSARPGHVARLVFAHSRCTWHWIRGRPGRYKGKVLAVGVVGLWQNGPQARLEHTPPLPAVAILCEGRMNGEAVAHLCMCTWCMCTWCMCMRMNGEATAHLGSTRNHRRWRGPGGSVPSAPDAYYTQTKWPESHLTSPHLTSSHLISSHLISSHLISSYHGARWQISSMMVAAARRTPR